MSLRLIRTRLFGRGEGDDAEIRAKVSYDTRQEISTAAKNTHLFPTGDFSGNVCAQEPALLRLCSSIGKLLLCRPSCAACYESSGPQQPQRGRLPQTSSPKKATPSGTRRPGHTSVYCRGRLSTRTRIWPGARVTSTIATDHHE